MNKKLVIMLSTFFAIMSVNFLLHSQKVFAETNDKYVKVNGRGSVKVMPDIAYVNIGLEVELKDPKDAQKENSKVTAIVEAIKSLGVAEKDIKTTGFSINPQYDYAQKSRVIMGYTMFNSVTVTVRNIEKVSDVIDKAVYEGANIATNISFNVADPTQHYNKALKLAIANANVKATTIAEAIGVKIGLPTSVTERTNYYGGTADYGNVNAKMDISTISRTPINVGELEIISEIEVSYSY